MIHQHIIINIINNSNKAIMKLKRLLSLLVLLAVVVTGSAQDEVNLGNIQASDLEDDGETLIVTDGTTLTGTLNGETQPYKILIAAGAEVTLDGVTINGVNHEEYSWAGLTCLGNATITLSGTNTVKGFYEDYPGIYVPEGSKLIIDGNGSLTASSNDYGAGIGGGYGISCGNIEIQNGDITATGGVQAAGIGAGYQGTCGDITISGGTIEATSDSSGAGIGSGYTGTCGNIAISGGNVTAFGGQYATGIGCGDEAECGDITISGGTIEATGGQNGAGIGTGSSMNGPSSCGDITIENTVTQVTATAGEYAISSIGIGDDVENECGTITIDGTVYPDGIAMSPFTYPFTLSTLNVTQGDDTQTFSYVDGETWEQAIDYHPENAGWSIMNGVIVYDGYSLYLDDEGDNAVNYEDVITDTSYYLIGAALTIDLSTLEGDYTAHDGDILTGELANPDFTGYQITIAADATVTLAGVTIDGSNTSRTFAGLTCLGNATIILEDGTENYVSGFGEDTPGIYVPDGYTLTIQGGTENPGKLTAEPSYDGSYGWAAGIGSGRLNGTCGNIEIQGGDITAIGGENSAGIGSGDGGSCGTITISGGKVTATGGGSGAGIGSGSWGACGSITISDGTIEAIGGDYGAGIGCGDGAECGNITVSGGTVIATGGDYAAGIGTGNSFNGTSVCLDITISGGTIEATGGKNAAAIGCGDEGGECGDINITEGVTSVTATKGEDARYSIGFGASSDEFDDYYSCGEIIIGEGMIDCTAGAKRMIANGITDDMSNAMKGQTVDISYSRTYTAAASGSGKASTLCLPFDLVANADDGIYATFSKVTENDGEYVVDMEELADGAQLSAGTPYMFLPSGSDKLTQGNSSYTVPGEGFTAASSATNSGWQFIGTYEKKTWPSGQKNLYGFAGKEYTLSNGDKIASDDIGSFRRFDYGTCAAFRCYLLAPESSGARGVSKAGSLPETLKVRLVKADGTTTAIGTLDTRTGEVEFGDDWYDLNGRRLEGQPTQKGVYIHNGNKTVIK